MTRSARCIGGGDTARTTRRRSIPKVALIIRGACQTRSQVTNCRNRLFLNLAASGKVQAGRLAPHTKRTSTVIMPVQLVTIEGNIGTGKSTLANHVAQYMPTMRFFASPEHEENPHWAAFAANPAKHALTMQCWLLRARLHVYLRALRHMEEARESVILDFSIWSDLIFATKHHEDGNLTAAEFERYQQLAREIYALELPPPHLSIVLQATPEICLQRHSRLKMPLPRSSPCGHPPLQQPTRLPRAARSALVGPRHLSCRREVTAGALVRPQSTSLSHRGL